MENGTVIWRSEQGILQKGKIVEHADNGNSTVRFIGIADVVDQYNGWCPEPFNDGEYLHYTRFHPQLKDMIGTEGYFYNIDFRYSKKKGILEIISDQGNPVPGDHKQAYAFFAVPIAPPKTELTLQQVADKFGIPADQLRIKEQT